MGKWKTYDKKRIKKTKPCQGLYEIRGPFGEHLYTGISVDMKRRLGEHNRKADVGMLLTEFRVKPVPNRSNLKRLERNAIRKKQPLYNIQLKKSKKPKKKEKWLL